MEELDNLIGLCQFYGKQENWVQAAGGNISVKYDGQIAIKKSGLSLTGVTSHQDVVRLSLTAEQILELHRAESLDPENDYLKLVAAHILGKNDRPSIELSFHSFGRKYTVHTHPTALNVFTCSVEGQKILVEKFGKSSNVAIVPYYKPGIILTLAMIDAFELQTRKTLPQITVLLNHGLIATADDSKLIKEVTSDFMRQILDDVGMTPPVSRQMALAAKMEGELARVLSKMTSGKLSPYPLTHPFLLDHRQALCSDPSFTAGVVYPDAVVYCGKSVLVTDSKSTEVGLQDNVMAFLEKYGHLPKVISYQDNFFAVAASSLEASFIEDVFRDHAQVLFLIKKRGWTPAFLNGADQDSLINWEAEIYRQNMAKGKA